MRHSARQLASVKRGSSDDAMEEGAGEEGREGPEGPGRARRARKGQEGPERKQQVNFAIYCSSLATAGKKKVNSAACFTILHLILAIEGELSPNSATVTSPQRQARFQASFQGIKSEAHSAAFTPSLKISPRVPIPIGAQESGPPLHYLRNVSAAIVA